MDKRRTVVIAVATLLAVIAGAAVFVFLKDSSSSSEPGEGQVNVLVAARNLPANTKAAQLIDSGAVKVVVQAKANEPVDALNSVSELEALVARNMVLTSAVPETTVLRRSSFAVPGGVGISLNGDLAADEQLVTIPAASIKGLAQGLLKPGDHVNVIISETGYTGALDDGANSAAPTEGGSPSAATGYLFQNLEVYAIGTSTVTPVASGSAAGTATTTSLVGTDITFRVNLVEATKLVAALHGGAQTAELWLTLVSQDFAPVASPVLSNASLLTDNYAKGATNKEPASPAIPVTPKASSTSVAGN